MNAGRSIPQHPCQTRQFFGCLFSDADAVCACDFCEAGYPHLAQAFIKRWLRRSIYFIFNFCHNWSPRKLPVGPSIFGSLSMNHSANLSSSKVRITKSINVLRKCEISARFIDLVCIFAILCDLIFFADYYIKITRTMIYAPFFIFVERALIQTRF
jgi:hypothetical protein